jgi:addiction module HigA family antidote
MKRLRNIHPGDVLKAEFLEPMQISSYRLSKETGLSQTHIGQIIRAERAVTAETALKLGKFFAVPAEFWLNLQNLYDLEEGRRKLSSKLRSIHSIKELGLAG